MVMNVDGVVVKESSSSRSGGGGEARDWEVLSRDVERDDEWEGNGAVFVVVMGVSGTGKSTLGIALSERLQLPYIEGDELHPKANVDKMSSGVPLTDEDRRPWLELIREKAERRCLDCNLGCRVTNKEGGGSCNGTSEFGVAGTTEAISGRDEGRGMGRRRGVVATCSALKKSYRDILRGERRVQKKPSSSSIYNPNPYPESNPPPPLPSAPQAAQPSPPPPLMQTYFVWINGSKELLQSRIETRQGHFFKASMLESQVRTLESPEGEEGVVVVPLELDTAEQVRIAVEGLGRLSNAVS